jgi:hypothetical protein
MGFYEKDTERSNTAFEYLVVFLIGWYAFDTVKSVPYSIYLPCFA